MKKVAVVFWCLGAAALLAAWMFARSGDASRTAVEEPSERASAEVPAGRPLERPREVDPVVDARDEERVVVDAATEGSDAATRPLALHFEVLVDGTAEFAGRDGRAELTLSEDGEERSVEVPVVDGAGMLVPKGTVAWVELDALTLGDEPCFAEASPVVPEDGVARFEVRPGPSLLLEVVDDTTGTGLVDVDVFVPAEWRLEETLHPGAVSPSLLAVRGGRSPVRVQPASRLLRPESTVLHVGAAGYAWKQTRVDLRGGGARQVRLVQGGSLEVEVVGEPPAGAALRLYETRPAGPAPDELPGDGRGPLVLSEPGPGARPPVVERLTPGHYLVAVEVGDWWEAPDVWAEAAVEVLPGARSFARLLLEAPVRSSFPVAGTLRVPVEWGTERQRVVIESSGLDEGGHLEREARVGARTDVEGGSSFAWDAGDLPTGTYLFELGEHEYAVVVEVPVGGDRDVRLELPAPARVEVELRDATTGRPAEVAGLSWYCHRPITAGGWGHQNAQRNGETGRYEFEAPAGEVELHHWNLFEYRLLRDTYALRPGPNRLTIDLEPALVLEIALLDGETRVPPPQEPWPSFEAIGHEGGAQLFSADEGLLWVTFDRPGRYAMRWPTLDGFEPIGELEVEIGPTETALEVPLERVR